jgi:hypothetical protein
LTSDCGEKKKKASEQINDEYNSEIKLGFTHKQVVDSKICLYCLPVRVSSAACRTNIGSFRFGKVGIGVSP